MRFTIRDAIAEDAGMLSALGAETFTATFGHLYSRENLDKFLRKGHSVEVYRAAAHDPRSGVWIAEDEAGKPVGYAVAGPCTLPVPDMPPNSGELARLYLLNEAKGTGLGARLLEITLGFLRDRFDHIYLSVYRDNTVAQRLYERYGFVKIHDYFYMVGDHADPEWLMELRGG
ncbi:MAG TPA: GNAT family N-acetyltransferase [Parvularcula sp.]|nr:GNAT family N-acetyltransferase [Parvularcula sp.]